MRKFNKEEFLKLPVGVIFTIAACNDINIKGQTECRCFYDGTVNYSFEYGDIYYMMGYSTDLKYSSVYDDNSEETFNVFEKDDLIAFNLNLSNYLSRYPDFYPDFKENLKESAKWQNIINNKDGMKNE